MTLRTQLTFGFTLAALLGVGATGASLITTSYRDAFKRVQREQSLLAENRANAISAEVGEEVERLRHLASLSELDLTDENAEPEKAVLRHARSLPRYFTLETSAVAPDGTVQWTEPPPPPAHSVRDSGWFLEASKSSTSFVTEDADVQGHTTRARLVVPIWHGDGKFAGCLTSTLDPAAASRWSERLSVDLGQSGTAALIDRSGKVVVTRGAPESLDLPIRGKAVAAALGGSTVSDWGEDAKGRRWLVTAVPLPNMGWVLMTRQAADELDDALDPELRQLALLLGAGLLFAIILGVLTSGTIARPLVALAQTARSVEQGRFEGVPPPSRGGELGDLERAFYSMTATLDARVKERTAALEKAQALLVEQGRYAAMGKTAAAIAHELKNALNGLGTATELLLQGKVPENAQAAVREQVRSEVERLRDTTDNLNLFGGQPQLHRSPQDLRPLIDRAVAVLRDRIDASGVSVEVSWPTAMPAVTCDGLKVQGVLINLLKNAVEAVEPQLDEPAPRGQVQVLGRVVPEGVELEIADSGPGIAGEVAAHMFEPFFTTKRTGTGLGLSIGRRIAEAHGGRLSFVPNQPQGARLVLFLPLSPRDLLP
ncbi:MAG: sensor histidine kinase [Deltaproteobacteria bacterium]|nr:sensor histidine kinase [Deltaproteobacteria bacterium]